MIEEDSVIAQFKFRKFDSRNEGIGNYAVISPAESKRFVIWRLSVTVYVNFFYNAVVIKVLAVNRNFKVAKVVFLGFKAADIGKRFVFIYNKITYLGFTYISDCIDCTD